MTDLIPDKLKPTEAEEKIQVPVEMNPSRPMNLQHLQHLQDKLGMARINPEQIVALRDMGIEAKQLGILNTMRGTTLITQQSLVNAMIELGNGIEKQEGMDEKIKGARAIGYLAGQLARVNTTSAKVEQNDIQATQEKEGKRKMSFTPGRKVGPPIIDVTPAKAAPVS